MTQPTARLAAILVAVDHSPESLYALDLAAAIGSPQQATLTVVHVRPHATALGLAPAGAVEYAQAEDEIDALVAADAAAHLAEYPGTWSVAIRSGHVGHELLAAAGEAGADLIVLGHRSHGTVHDAILGSVASSTVHHATLSVLVAVPPR
ncbi:MAG: universal stress protein [Actinomycetota bacterium]|nr:universal stress protein [Actinomycetota bacterium]